MKLKKDIFGFDGKIFYCFIINKIAVNYNYITSDKHYLIKDDFFHRIF